MSQIWDRPSRSSTGNYNHVAIYLDGMIYHASGQAGVVCQEPADFFESNHLYDLYVYPEMDIQSVEVWMACPISDSSLTKIKSPFSNMLHS